jgi:hypothetical protein
MKTLENKALIRICRKDLTMPFLKSHPEQNIPQGKGESPAKCPEKVSEGCGVGL